MGAVLVASIWLEEPTGHGWLLAGLTVLGTALVLAPLEAYTLMHFGRVVPSHVGDKSGLLRAGWMAERVHLATRVVAALRLDGSGSDRLASFWAAAPVAVLAFVPLPSGIERRGRRFLWIVGVLTWRSCCWPRRTTGAGNGDLVICCLRTSRWFSWRLMRSMPFPTKAECVALIVLLVGCIWIQRTGYRQLRGTKQMYGRVVDFVAKEVEPGGYVVTDLWWLDQVAAAATSQRQLVYAGDETTATDIMRRLNKEVVPIVTVIRSQSESADVKSWTDQTCYVEIHRHTLDVRDLVAIWLHHRCSS